jgi:hypothetical protein
MRRKREPHRLRRGKKWHGQVEAEWKKVPGARTEKTIEDMSGHRRRIDILVDEGSDWVTVIEAKRTDWDRLKRRRVRPNALRHARQIWIYVEKFVDGEGRDVCPGVIYDKVPGTPGRVDEVESILGERAVQVVWRSESMAALRKRKGRRVRGGPGAT